MVSTNLGEDCLGDFSLSGELFPLEADRSLFPDAILDICLVSSYSSNPFLDPWIGILFSEAFFSMQQGLFGEYCLKGLPDFTL